MGLSECLWVACAGNLAAYKLLRNLLSTAMFYSNCSNLLRLLGPLCIDTLLNRLRHICPSAR